jgi:hypothetical protein
MMYDRGGPRWARFEDLVRAYLLRTRPVLAVVKVAHGAVWAPMLDAWANAVGEVADAHGRRIVLPDLQVHLRIDRHPHRWYEVKYKITFARFHVAHLDTTGIDRPVFDHYQLVEARTAMPVDIVFCHEVQRQARVARIDHGWFPGRGNGANMVYWAWQKLPIVATFDELEALDATTPPGTIGAPLFAPRALQRNLFDAPDEA